MEEDEPLVMTKRRYMNIAPDACSTCDGPTQTPRDRYNTVPQTTEVAVNFVSSLHAQLVMYHA
jgi:hypothetical protein